jgi:hypothetical protein
MPDHIYLVGLDVWIPSIAAQDDQVVMSERVILICVRLMLIDATGLES